MSAVTSPTHNLTPNSTLTSSTITTSPSTEPGPDEASLAIDSDKHEPRADITADLKPQTKQSSNQLNVPSSLPIRSQSPDTLSLVSADDFSELRRVRSSSFALSDHADPLLPSGILPKHGPPQGSWRSALSRFWVRNKGLALVLLAQVFGTVMNIGARLLESAPAGDAAADAVGGMHPFQIIFARMTITMILSVLYMWYTETPDFPFGARGVRLLLVARGFGGFWGVFGIYWSLQYLPLADATVLTFIAPFIACFVCAKILHEPFTRVEQLGGLVSLLGVVLIARPSSFFGSSPSPAPDSSSTTTTTDIAPHATPSQRLAAVGVAMLGVCGAAVAYTTIRMIGTRAHPLISVNYFAAWCTAVSGTMLLLLPSEALGGAVLPTSARAWGLLLLIGLGGFALQFLLTAGLSYERSSRATNMVYSQMLFALAADRVIWGVVPGGWSIAGSALILGSAVVVAVKKEGGPAGEGGVGARVGRARGEGDGGDEEVGLVDVEGSGVQMEMEMAEQDVSERARERGVGGVDPFEVREEDEEAARVE